MEYDAFFFVGGRANFDGLNEKMSSSVVMRQVPLLSVPHQWRLVIGYLFCVPGCVSIDNFFFGDNDGIDFVQAAQSWSTYR